jgi:hypothetical protein
MSKGAGKVRRALLATFADDPKPLSSYDLTERVYGVRPDRAGDVWLTDAQLSSTRRVLGALAKQGGRRGFRHGRQHWATPKAWARYEAERRKDSL